MKKEHNISALITLSAGAVAAFCCLLNRVPILNTLKYVLLVLVVFFVIGRIAERIIQQITEKAEEAARIAAEEAEAARIAKEQEDASLQEEAEGKEADLTM